MNSNDILCPAAYALMFARTLLTAVNHNARSQELKQTIQDIRDVVWNAGQVSTYTYLEVGVVGCFPRGETRSILLAAKWSDWCIEEGTRYDANFDDAANYAPLYSEAMLHGFGGVVSGDGTATFDSPLNTCRALHEYEGLIDHDQFWLMGDDWWKPRDGWNGVGAPLEVTRAIGKSADW